MSNIVVNLDIVNLDRKYSIFPGPSGWIGLVGSEKGISRLAMKPAPEEVLEDLADDIRGCEQDDTAFAQVRRCLDSYFDGNLSALDEIPSGPGRGAALLRRRLGGMPPNSGRRNPQLRLAGRRGRAPQRRPRRWSGHGQEPPGPGNPLPPGNRQQRRPPRLRRRRLNRKGQAVATRAATPASAGRSVTAYCPAAHIPHGCTNQHRTGGTGLFAHYHGPCPPPVAPVRNNQGIVNETAAGMKACPSYPFCLANGPCRGKPYIS